MKRLLPLLLWTLLCVLSPTYAGLRYNLSPIDFEDGAIPAGWTQENVTGNVNWSVEGGNEVTLVNPSGAKSGLYRLAVRRPAGQSSGFVTRLISPAMDLRQAQNPTLYFAHAQAASYGFVDTLRVYYRTTASAAWALLKEFTSPIALWTNEAIPLAGYLSGSAYQIAFEVADNNGYGVVMDDIYVLQPSICQNPLFQYVKASSTTADVEVVAAGTGYGSTADLFDLVISKVAMNPDTATAANTAFFFQATEQDIYHLTGLDSDTKYYLYLRTNCADNATGYTDWVSSDFTTTALVDLPYVQNFNSGATGINYGVQHGWTFANNLDGTKVVPYVYTGTNTSYRSYYSIDSTGYLAFVGDASTTISPVEAGKYMYAATPEINGNLSQCEVAFWGTAYTYLPNGTDDYASELSVGVMTDPSDYSTFVEVKKVKIESAYQFKHFTVSLAEYTGTGKYVALVSKSAKPNVFFVDNFEVYIPTVATPALAVHNALPTGFEVVPSLPAGFDSWNLKVSTQYARDAAALADSVCLINLSGLTAANYTVAVDESLLAGKTVTVYVQAVKGGVASAWSFPVTIRVPNKLVVPFDLSFNTGTYKEVALKTLNNELHTTSSLKACGDLFFPLTSFTNMYPTISSATPTYEATSHLNLNGIGNYCVLPYVEGDLDTLELTFRYASYGSDYQGKVAVGVMTDPYDLSTFVTVAEYDAVSGSKYAKIICDFSSYTGAGHYVALRALAPVSATTSYGGSANAIDNLSLHKVSTCRDASNLRAEAGASKAVIRWDAMGMTQWLVRVYGNSAATDTVQELMVAQDSLLLTGLTPGTTYYYAVHTICGTDTLAVETADLGSFTTSLGIPYKQDFSTSTSLSTVRFTGKKGLAEDVFAGTALTTTTSSNWKVGSKTVTGYVSTTGSALYLEIYTTSKQDWAILPELLLEAEPQESIVLNFDIALPPYSSSYEDKRNSGTDDQFMVVISTDGGETWSEQNATIWNNKADSTTDYVLNDLPMTSFQKATVDLTQYKGQKVCVAFYAESTVGNADNWIIIDNIVIKAMDANCVGVTTLQATTLSESQASVVWAAGGTQSVHLMVSDAVSGVSAFEGDITVSPYTLTGLKANTPYIVRAYQSCNPEGDTLITSFRTQCSAIEVADLGTVTFNKGAEDILCWTVGIADTTGVGSASLTEPYVKNYPKFGNVLYLEKPKTGKGNNYYAVMPELAIDSVKKYQVAFSAGTTVSPTDTTDVHQLYIGVMTDLSDPSTMVVVDTVNLQFAADSLSLRNYVIGFDNYDGDDYLNYGKYVFFLAAAPDKYADLVLIDNVYIEPVMGCHQINSMEATEISASSAKLVWESDAQEYEVLVSDHICNPDTMDAAVFRAEHLTDMEVSLSALLPQTTYYAYVRGICGVGDTARWSGHTIFKTACGVPYFEDITSTLFTEDGWKGYKGIFGANDTLLMANLAESSLTTAWYMTTPPSTIKGMSDTVARVEVYSTGTYNALLVSPAISLPASAAQPMRVSFKVAKGSWSSTSPTEVTSTDDKFSLIISTDDGQTWTRANSTIWASDGTGDYDYNAITLTASRCNVNISQYAGQTVRLGFYTESTEYSPDTYFYLDSVSVEYFDYECLPISMVCPLEQSTSALTLEIVPDKLGKAAMQWQYTYGVANSGMNIASAVATDTTVFAITNLDAVTSYDVYVRAICAVGDTSAWAGPFTFKTSFGLPYSDGFNDSSLEGDWTGYKGIFKDSVLYAKDLAVSTSTTAWYMTTPPTAVKGMSGTAARVEVYGSTGSYNALLVSPSIEIPALTSEDQVVLLDFLAAKGSYSSSAPDEVTSTDDKLSVIVSTDNGATWARANSTVWASDGTGDYDYNDLTLNAKRCNVDLSRYAGQTIRLGFYTESTVSNPDTYLYIDSVSVDTIAFYCAKVDLIKVNQITSASAEITLEESLVSKPALKWQYLYCNSGATPDYATAVDVDTTSFVISGLYPIKSYDVYARAICAVGDTSAWAGPCTLTTLLRVPYYKEFDDLDDWKKYSGILPDNLFAGTAAFTSPASTGWGISTSSNAFDGNSHAKVNIYNTYKYWLVSPVIDASNVVADTALNFSFSLAYTDYGNANAPEGTTGQKFYVLVSDDGGATWKKENAFVWSDEAADSAQYSMAAIPVAGQTYVLDFSKHIGKQIQIAFCAYSSVSSGADNDLHMDNVVLEVPTDCRPVDGIKATALSGTSIRVDFNPNDFNDATQWQYAIGTKGTVVDEMTPQNISDSTFVLSDLVPGTDYDIYVRTKCGMAATSRWIGPASVRTAYAFPYKETFDNVSSAFSEDWTRYSSMPLAKVLADSTSFATVSPVTLGWTNGTSDALADANHVKVNIYSTGSGRWLVSPLIDLAGATTPMQLTFDIAYTDYGNANKPKGTDGQKFYVLVSEDGGATWRKNNLTTWSDAAADSAQFTMAEIPNGDGTTVELDFSGYVDKVIRVAFGTEATSNDNDIHLDNILLQKTPTCRVVKGLSLTDVSFDKATISFLPATDSLATQWQYTYCLTDSAINPELAVTVDTTLFTISGLQPSTSYDVYVRGICAVGDTSAWSLPFTFKTKYGVPYFDEFSSNSLSDDWKGYKGTFGSNGVLSSLTSSTSTTAWYMTTPPSAIKGMSGTAARVEVWSTGSYNALLVSPEITLPQIGEDDQPVRVSFKVAKGSYSYSGDPSEVTSTDDKFSLIISTDGGQTWTRANSTIWASDGTGDYDYNAITLKASRYNVNISQYAGQAIHLGFYTESTVSTPDTYFYLDSVSVEYFDYECLPISNIALENATISSMALSIAPDKNGKKASQWQYAYGLAGATVDMSAAVTIDTTLFTISGLQPATEYDVYARAICAEGDTSAWAGPFTHKTAYTIPYHDAFAETSLEEDWKGYEGVFVNDSLTSLTASTDAAAWSFVDKPDSISGMAGYVARTRVYGIGSYNALLVSPRILLPETPADSLPIAVSFKAAKGSYSSTGKITEVVSDDDKFSVIVSTDDGKTWTRANSTIWASDGTGYHNYNAISRAASLLKVDITQYAGQNIRLGFYTESTVSTPDTYFYLDSVSVGRYVPACEGVEDVSAKMLSDEAYLTFFSFRASDTVEYVYGTEDVNLTESTIYRADSAKKAHITGLIPSTTYFGYARTLCAEGDTSAWVGPISFTTGCAVGVGTSYNFDAEANQYNFYSTYKMENCWKSFYESTSYRAEVQTNTSSSFYAHSGEKALYFYTNSTSKAYAVMPMVEGDMDSLQVTFWSRPGYAYYSSYSGSTYMSSASSTYAHAIKVGTMTNPYDISTFQLVETITEPAYTSSDYINNDPEGTNYYRQHTVRLKGAEGKYIVFMSDFGATNYFTIDDVTIEEIPSCIPPLHIVTEVLSATSAKLKWDSDADSVLVILTDAVGAETRYIAQADSIVLTNLESAHQYNVQLQSFCGAEYSEMSAVYTFFTPASVPYLQEFEATAVSDLIGWERARGLLNDILDGGEFAASTKWYCGTKATAAEANIEGKSAYIEIWSTSTYDWLLSPILDLTTVNAEDNLQLSMTLALSHWSQHVPVTSGAQPDDVFAVVISEDGGETWTADNVTRWDTAATSAYSYDEIPVEGETYYVDLNKYKGKVIRIGLYGESTVSNTDNYLYVDNFAIDNMDPSCMGVKLQIDSVVAATMYASWQTMGNDSVMVQLTDEAGNTVYSATTTDTTFAYSNLAWHTTYTLSVQQICGSRAAQKTFTTPYAPISIPYHEPFGKEAMERWTEAGGVTLEEVFAGSEFTKTTSSWYIGLKTDGTEVNIHDTSAYMNVYSSTQKEWLISPSIIIPELDALASVELSFTAALSSFSGHAAVDPAKQQSHRFAVVISEDDGATWKQSNMTLWDNTGKGDYVYNDIPVVGQTYMIDLGKYQGKVIRVALYGESTVSGQGDNYLYVDDISIKGLVEVNYAASQCNSADYQDELFTIPYDELVLGTTEYTKRVNGAENTPDTLYTLSLTVYPAVMIELFDTVCQGTHYTNYGFDEVINASSTFTVRHTSSNGCDSMVVLKIEMLPTIFLDTTIRACESYEYNGTVYYSNQVFTDTLVSSLGCDSIVRTFLEISSTGSQKVEWRTAICAGDTYTDDLFDGLVKAGVYTATATTDFGCDSTVVLHLLVADENMAVHDTIELSELPYIYEGDVFLGENTTPGEHQHDVMLSCGQVTLYIFVNGETAIHNTTVQSLSVAPNPVAVGEPIHILTELPQSETFEATIHSAVGQMIFRTDTFTKVLPGISTAGVYTLTVRIHGNVYKAKVLVR